MKTFIFIVLIPAVSGVLTNMAGWSYFGPETFNMALAINLPICILSVGIDLATE